MASRQRRRNRITSDKPRGWLRLALLLVLLLAGAAALLAGCATTAPPKTQTELCLIFDEHRDWYRQARSAEQRWGTPIAIKMAFVQQESAFDARARPRRGRVLGLFPGRPVSTAYGYAQAVDAAWDDYRAATGRRFARRNHMADALDFIGWYNDVSHRRLGIPLTETRHLYYAYHEGHAGYRLGNWQEKAWLQRVAGRVEERAQIYQRQLEQCESRLNRRWWQLG
jgi:hypothetical protein